MPYEPQQIISRNQDVERTIWERHIAPIIVRHNLRDKNDKLYQYRFVFGKGEMTEESVHLMVRKTMNFKEIFKDTLVQQGVPNFEPTEHYEVSYNLMEDVKWLSRKKQGEETKKAYAVKVDGMVITIDMDFKDVFRSFLKNLFDDGILPEFLEILRQDRPFIEESKSHDNTGDDQKDARSEIIEYAKRLDKAGNPLVNADFTSDSDDENTRISKHYNVTPDTLRKYTSDAGLLSPSKTGPKQTHQ